MFPPHLCRSTYILQPALPVSHVARGILLWSEPLRFALIRFAVARAVTRRFRVITALRRTDRFWPHAADNLTGSVRPIAAIAYYWPLRKSVTSEQLSLV